MKSETPVPAAPVDAEGGMRREIWDFVIAVAAGCFDYGGGYRSDNEKLKVFHHGIQTVNQALASAREKGLSDTQVASLYRTGVAALEAIPATAAEKEKQDG